MFKKIIAHYLIIAMVLWSLPITSWLGASSWFVNAQTEPTFVADEVIIKFNRQVVSFDQALSSSKVTSVLNGYDLDLAETIAPNMVVAKIKNEQTVSAVINNMSGDNNIEYIEPNYIKKLAQVTPNDPDFNELWALENTGQTVYGDTGTSGADIEATGAWDGYPGLKNGIIVAELDSGIAYDHEDLAANMWQPNGNCYDETNNVITGGCPNHGWDYANYDNDPKDDNGHGTHVAGTIGAVGNNNIGVVGVNWNAEIMALKISDSLGFLDTADWVKAVSFAKNNGAQIINASFGGGDFSNAEYEAIANFPGLFIAAAGNYGHDNDVIPYYPASYDLPNIIAVAATDQNDNLTSWSHYGDNTVDVAAPGDNIYSTYITNDTSNGGNAYDFLYGTSMATPYVSGLASLLWNANTALSAAQIQAIIYDKTDPLPSLTGKTVTGGRINAKRAIDSLRPILGFNEADYIPTDEFIFSPFGDGDLTVRFKAITPNAGVPLQLAQFEYSLDNGTTWQPPTNGDNSGSLSSRWNTGYVTGTDWNNAPVNNFVFNTQHADVTGMDNERGDVKIRFRASNSVLASYWVEPKNSLWIDNQAQSITAAYAAVGDDKIYVTFEESVYSEVGHTGKLNINDFDFEDKGTGNKTITEVEHIAGSNEAVLTVSAPFTYEDLNDGDSNNVLHVKANTIFDAYGNAVAAHDFEVDLKGPWDAGVLASPVNPFYYVNDISKTQVTFDVNTSPLEAGDTVTLRIGDGQDTFEFESCAAVGGETHIIFDQSVETLPGQLRCPKIDLTDTSKRTSGTGLLDDGVYDNSGNYTFTVGYNNDNFLALENGKFAIDTVAPSQPVLPGYLTGDLNADHVINMFEYNDISIEVPAEDYSSVGMYKNGLPLDIVQAVVNGKAGFTNTNFIEAGLVGLNDPVADYTDVAIGFKITDKAGNVSVINELTYSKDTIGPSPATHVGTFSGQYNVADNIINQQELDTVWVDLQVTDAASAYIELHDGNEIIYGGEEGISNPGVITIPNETLKNLGILGLNIETPDYNIPKILKFIARDTAGNDSEPSQVITFTKDTIAPIFTAAYSAVGSDKLHLIFNDGVYTLPNAIGKVELADLNYIDTNGSKTMQSLTHEAGTAQAIVTMSAPFTESDLMAGPDQDNIRVKADALFDNAGNKVAATTIDVLPSGIINYQVVATDNNLVDAISNISQTQVVLEINTVELTPGDMVKITLSDGNNTFEYSAGPAIGGETKVVFNGGNGNRSEVHAPKINLLDESHRVSGDAYIIDGNYDNTGGKIFTAQLNNETPLVAGTVLIDRILPEPPTHDNSLDNSSDLTISSAEAGIVSLTVNANTGETVTLFVDGQSTGISHVANSPVIFTNADLVQAGLAGLYPTVPDFSTPKQIAVQAQDSAGNVSGLSELMAVIKDTQGPVLQTIAWDDRDNSGLYSTGDKLHFIFSENIEPTAIMASTPELVLPLTNSHNYGTGGTLSVTDNTIIVTLGSGATINRSDDTVNPSDIVKDLAGNVDQSTAQGFPAIDTVAPSAPVVTDYESFTTVAQQTIRGTKDANTALLINYQEVLPINALTNWAYQVKLIEAPNSFTIMAQDAAGNRSDLAFITIAYDQGGGGRHIPGIYNGSGGSGRSNIPTEYIPEDSAITINNGDDYTKNRTVNLDLYSENAVQMQVSNNVAFNNSGWQSYRSSLEWELPKDINEAKVYARFKGLFGATSDIVSDTIRIGTKEDFEVKKDEDKKPDDNNKDQTNNNDKKVEIVLPVKLPGKILRTIDDATVYYVVDNLKRAFLTEADFLSWGFNWDEVQTVASLDMYLLGAPMKARPDNQGSTGVDKLEGALVKTKGDSAVYLIENGKRRAFLTEPAFYSYGYSWDDVMEVSNLEPYMIGEAMPNMNDSKITTGSLIKGSDAAVYLVNDLLEKAWIVSQEVFWKLGYTFKQVIRVSNSKISELRTTTPIDTETPLKDGDLIKYTTGSTVYVVENGQRRPIMTEGAFTSRGFNWDDVKIIDRDENSDIFVKGEPVI